MTEANKNEYTIYNPDNGKILRIIKCLPSNLEINMSENEKYIEGRFRSPEYIIEDGKAKAVDVPEDLDEIRRKNLSLRGSLLEASDWTQLPDSPLSDSKKAEWATYRQALRDITTHSNWPNLEDSDWPTKPS